MVKYCVGRLRPQVGALLVTANRNLAQYARICDCQVVEDVVGEFAGPLAGIASAMSAATTPYIVTAPCDSPLLAADFTVRLCTELRHTDAEISVARSAARIQPVFALLRCDLLPSVLGFLRSGERKVDRWYAEHRLAEVDFSDQPEIFLNINTPDEQRELEMRLGHQLEAFHVPASSNT